MNDAIVGFIGVIVGAAITAAGEYWTERRSRDRNARYLAIRVVSLLDRYVQGCTEVAGDDGLCMGQPDASGCHAAQADYPDYNVQSLDVDWKSIPSTLMYRIISFQNHIEAAQNKISAEFNYSASPPDFVEGFDERRYQYATLGITASEIADELRKSYEIPERDVVDWDPVSYLRDCKQKMSESIAQRRERNNTFTAELLT